MIKIYITKIIVGELYIYSIYINTGLLSAMFKVKKM